WHTWATPAQFFATTFLLGSLAVGAAFMGSIMWRRRAALKKGEGGLDLDEGARTLLTRSLKGVGLTAVAMLGVEFVIIPLHISNLSAAGGAAAESAAVFSGAWFVARLVLVFAGAGLLAVFLYRYASAAKDSGVRLLAIVSTSAFVLVLAGELIGRSQFYEQMARIGM
ncbi:hypothetical protein QUV83_17590, partial [Cellulomonas cellasea]|uniref:hypothetical protein n=1 Tax=Cellulomonas cellasea TaxID=43670 RepID=UPI0025A4912A